MIITKGNTITIVIDNDELNDYLEYYFFKYPRRKKKPIERTIPPSLNQWGNMNRQAKNVLKQNWDTFMRHIVEKYGMQDLKIERAKVTCRYYFKTKHRRDLDNFTCKIFMDGLVDAGLFIDDSCQIINPLVFEFGGYSKEDDRMEIIVERLDLIEKEEE